MRCPHCNSANTVLASSHQGETLLDKLHKLSRPNPIVSGGRKFIICKDCGKVTGPIYIG